MLHTLQTQGSQRPVMLLYGVTRDCDLVKTDALDTFIQQLTGYRWLPVVADENSTCPQRGFVTDHLDDAMLNNGDVDISAARRRWLTRLPRRCATADHRRGSGMRNLSPARARRHKETNAFTDKVVVITGAAQGIGRQTAEQAAAEGAALLLIDRSSYVHELAATLAQSGCLVLALEADLEAWESTEQAFAAGVAHWPYRRADQQRWGTIWARPLPNISRSRLKRSAARCSHAVGLPRGAAGC